MLATKSYVEYFLSFTDDMFMYFPRYYYFEINEIYAVISQTYPMSIFTTIYFIHNCKCLHKLTVS